jgi:hypothetical protein
MGAMQRVRRAGRTRRDTLRMKTISGSNAANEKFVPWPSFSKSPLLSSFVGFSGFVGVVSFASPNDLKGF